MNHVKMQIAVLAACAIAAISVVAETKPASTNLDAKAIQERREASRRRMLEKTGGRLECIGSQKGLFLIVNAQKEVKADRLRELAGSLAEVSHFNIRFDEVAAYSGDWAALKKEKGASGVVVVVSDDKTSPLLVSPDEQWAVVNVKKLGTKLNDAGKARFLEPRTLKQVCRALALLSGSASHFKGSPGGAYSIDDLDERGETLPMDQVVQLSGYLESIGMTRKVVVTYRKACQEGWAPSPTNDVQKKIWDETFAIPDKPIKIQKKK